MAAERKATPRRPAQERPLEVRIALAKREDPVARRRLVELLARLLFDEEK